MVAPTPDQEKLSAILQARIISLTTREGMAVVESAQGNGCETWCQLSQTFDPMTDAWLEHLIISVDGYKIAKNADIRAAMVHWERQMLRIEKDHKDTISPKNKRAFL